MRTITTKEQIVPSICIDDETITYDMLKKMLNDILECNVEFLRVTFKSHSIILHKFTNLEKVLEYFKDLEKNYCEHCGCAVAECNGGFEEPEEHFECAA